MAGPFTPTIRGYTEATSLEATDAFILDRIGTGTMWIDGLNAFPQSLIITLNAFYEGDAPPQSNMLLGGWSLPIATTFPANHTDALAIGWGFHAQAGYTPTSNFIIQLALNDAPVGSITIAADGGWTYATTGNATWAGAVRDRVTATAPAIADATLNRFYFTMVGTRTL